MVNATLTNKSQFNCSLCNITASSEAHLKSHLEGSKHAKKLKAANEPPSYVPVNDSILATVISSAKKEDIVVEKFPSPPKFDLSIYRTPSGNFYCKTCDITVTNENAFSQHLFSRKHAKQLAAEKSN